MQSKYWNHSSKGDCQSTDDTEGITLESLGGVFIATLFGLALAMITLAGEVFYYRRKQIKPLDNKAKEAFGKGDKLKKTTPKQITIGSTFKPVQDFNKSRISPVTLYPKSRNRLPHVN